MTDPSMSLCWPLSPFSKAGCAQEPRHFLDVLVASLFLPRTQTFHYVELPGARSSVSGHLEPGSDPSLKDKDCSMEQGGLIFLLLPKPQAPKGPGKGRGDLSAGLTLLRSDGTCSDTGYLLARVQPPQAGNSPGVPPRGPFLSLHLGSHWKTQELPGGPQLALTHSRGRVQQGQEQCHLGRKPLFTHGSLTRFKP